MSIHKSNGQCEIIGCATCRAANETEVIPKCARVECQTLRAQLDVARTHLDTIVYLDINDVESAKKIAANALAKLEELEKCDKGE